MRFRARKTFRLGPLFFTFTQRGFSSWGIRIGRFTRNFTRGSTSIDTPGPGGLHSTGRRKRKRRDTAG
ncbi:hypothetical protein GCM10009609_13850 [Pseudonocardia aurantiaca]|uniref:DUF4236 domain-containing protein n=1 Tax=Pseudonocardia aurantiaca TaxID=75290 RepID=A0ABW4FEC2_9PSEU